MAPRNEKIDPTRRVVVIAARQTAGLKPQPKQMSNGKRGMRQEGATARPELTRRTIALEPSPATVKQEATWRQRYRRNVRERQRDDGHEAITTRSQKRR